MRHEEFIEKCKQLAVDYVNKTTLKKGISQATIEDAFIVWSCKTLQNSKAILSLKHPGAPLFEMTLNGDKQEIYVDTYVKKSNKCIKV